MANPTIAYLRHVFSPSQKGINWDFWSFPKGEQKIKVNESTMPEKGFSLVVLFGLARVSFVLGLAKWILVLFGLNLYICCFFSRVIMQFGSLQSEGGLIFVEFSSGGS